LDELKKISSGSKDFILDEYIEYEIVHHYKSKGYSVSEYGAWDKNDKSGLTITIANKTTN
jgi:hypothetical protein